MKVGNTESTEKNRAYTGRLKKTEENKHRQRLHREKAKENKELAFILLLGKCLQFCKIIHQHCVLEI